MIELTVRQRQILGILNSRKGFMRGREIADFLGVTDRTVRSDMQGLAEFLEEKGNSMKKSHEAVEDGAAPSCRAHVKGCGFRRSNLLLFFSFLPLLIVSETSSCSDSSLSPRAAPSPGI